MHAVRCDLDCDLSRKVSALFPLWKSPLCEGKAEKRCHTEHRLLPSELDVGDAGTQVVDLSALLRAHIFYTKSKKARGLKKAANNLTKGLCFLKDFKSGFWLALMA